ncbi:ATP-binding cassette domain-containing protein [Oerskovia sp. M15]
MRDATVTFHHGKINALIGPNGSGKTTFFNCVTGMIKPDSGTVTFRGEDITRRAPHRIARAGIGRSFQLCRVFPRMTVLENMLVAVRRTRVRELLGAHATRRRSTRRALCSCASASSTSRTSRRATCPTGSRSCSSSRASSWATRTRSCSTSPPAA